jgi:transposase InsO family protein
VTAACPNHVWALDFLVDRTADGRPIKILTVTDEHTREALATQAARRIGADDTVSTLEQIVERRGTTPAYIRCDNGPELTAEALKDWCRFTGTTTAYIEPGAPWQNPYVESFNGHLRRELLDLESFNTLLEAQLLLDDWRLEYNHHRPHQSLNYQTPAAYARQWHAPNDHRPSQQVDQKPGSGHLSNTPKGCPGCRQARADRRSDADPRPAAHQRPPGPPQPTPTPQKQRQKAKT